MKKKSVTEIRINTRGCKAPMPKDAARTIAADAELLTRAYEREAKKQKAGAR